MTLYYVNPPGCPKLKAGALVAVCEGSGKVMSFVKVKKSGRTAMTLEDGRKFRNETGWWIGGSQDWSFPFIRMLTREEREGLEK